MKDRDLRKSMGMPTGRSGIFVNEIEPTSPESSEVFKKSDVLLSFDGVKIDNDGKGTYPYLTNGLFSLTCSNIVLHISV